MARRDKPLYRDTSDQKIAGVCSGLGRYFDLNTNLVRVGFVVATVFYGVSILAYAALWFVMEPAPEGYFDDDTEMAEGTDKTDEATEPTIDLTTETEKSEETA